MGVPGELNSLRPPAAFTTHTLPAVSMAIPGIAWLGKGLVSPPPVNPVEVEMAEPFDPSSEMLAAPALLTQTLPEPSMARPAGPLRPPPVYSMAIVKSLGETLNDG